MNRVLIVDDQAPVIRVLRLGLESAGYEVATAANGKQALERIAEQEPDFLVTDIDMPEMTGQELCQEITSSYPDRRFPIVVLTSRTEREHREWTADMSLLSFMEKPVSIRRLVAHIGECSSSGAGADRE